MTRDLDLLLDKIDRALSDCDASALPPIGGYVIEIDRTDPPPAPPGVRQRVHLDRSNVPVEVARADAAEVLGAYAVEPCGRRNGKSSALQPRPPSTRGWLARLFEWWSR